NTADKLFEYCGREGATTYEAKGEFNASILSRMGATPVRRHSTRVVRALWERRTTILVRAQSNQEIRQFSFLDVPANNRRLRSVQVF
ncbi:MAG: hypothetical protein AAFX94_23825, partial [Myxococcota bacterium]